MINYLLLYCVVKILKIFNQIFNLVNLIDKFFILKFNKNLMKKINKNNIKINKKI